MNTIDLLTTKFLQAFYEKEWPGTATPPIAKLTLDEAYTVQDQVAEQRIQRGEEVAGFKVGCTSEAIQSQFGLTEPIFARLFYPYIYENGVTLDWTHYANCAIEPEVVFSIGTNLQGTDLSYDQLIDAIEWVSPGIEIHNFRFWFSPPTSQELICSGGIHAGLVIGQSRVSPKQLSFEHELFSVYKNGTHFTSAPASEIMGSPLRSLQWLVNALTRRGGYLKKGSLVIPGSPVSLTPIDQDTELHVAIDDVGEVVCSFKQDHNVD